MAPIVTRFIAGEILKRFLLLLQLLIFLNGLTSYAESGSVVFILDGSNSMWGRMKGKEKILVARDVVRQAITDLPADLSVGLAAYGHRRKQDCSDIEMVLPVGKHTDSEVRKALDSIAPHGKTPITAALEFVARQTSNHEGSIHFVLVSDGKETCEGDPCAAAEALRKTGVKTTVHVVGFDVTEEEKQQLQCIASKGGGSYLDADSGEELTTALGKIQESVKDDISKVTGPAATQDLTRTFWRMESDGSVYEGTRSLFMRIAGEPLIQFVSEDAVNIALTVAGKLDGKQTISSARFSEGRGPVCEKVGKVESFQIQFDTSQEGWLGGTFSGNLGCPDYHLMPVKGSFHVKAPE